MKGIRSEKKIGSILMQNNKQKTLILGGAASGKSQYAEELKHDASPGMISSQLIFLYNMMLLQSNSITMTNGLI